jgi:hypothetical protein
MIAALYTSWMWWPSALRSLYLTEVHGRSAAIKISEDERIDRGLYFTGEGTLVYTRSDGIPNGTVRRYRTLKYPGREWNESFVQPNIFVE